MDPSFTIDLQTGCLGVGGVRLQPLQPKSEIMPQVDAWLKGARDHGNGYEWLYLSGLTFGGQPASLALCFHDEQLAQASWNVQLPDAPMEGGWPSRQAIDEEITFVRQTLAQEGLRLGDSSSSFWWGDAWSSFDARGFLASNGVRYRAG